MRKIKLLVIGLALCTSISAQWKPAGEKIKSKWATEINPENVLSEYPRPIMVRSSWKNLNGLWNYAIQKRGLATPTKFDGKILVPFAVESSLSGVMKEVGDENELWYSTTFNVPKSWKGKDLLLHFGAVDWEAEIWVNDIKVGSHKGGYTPFSFNIAPFLTNGTQKLVVKVWDPTSDGNQPRGKQVNKPEGIWYTPVTGIWQTVWLEPVPKTNISNIKTTPDLDHNSVNFKAIGSSKYGDVVEVTVFDGANQIAKGKAAINEDLKVTLKNPKLWSPESPFLYDVKIKLTRNGKTLDEVKSYFAMRKISMKRDDKGIIRMQLNNKDYFHFGPLDQGWWPDGLYTAPSDEALKYDIVKTKEFGYNMIRKHVKVESARWYTHCDRIGMLVWQDMPSGGESPRWQGKKFFDDIEVVRSASSEAIYRKEWKEIMDYLYSYPSIVVWVPFNEAWGQFKTKEISDWTKAYDPSRLVNSASGGNHYNSVGDILDLHNYPNPKLYIYDAQRVTVLGEYGGIGLPLEGHLWKEDDNWGYVKFKNSEQVTNEYIKYAKELMELVKVGFSAAIYTQTTDVEGEVNGLMTYDRKVDKMDVKAIKKINQEVIDIIQK